MKKDKMKAFIVLSATVLVLVVCLLAKQRTDTAFTRLIYGETFTVAGNTKNTVAGRELTIKNSGSSPATMKSTKMTLEAGRYEFSFLYHLFGSEQARMEIRRDSYLSPDNIEGIVYYSQNMEQGSVLAKGEFTISEKMHDVYIGVYLPADSEITLSRIALDAPDVHINDYNIFAVLTVFLYLVLLVYQYIKSEKIKTKNLSITIDFFGIRIVYIARLLFLKL